MARSIKKKKKSSNRDQLRASVTYSPDSKTPGIYTKTSINDGDKSTYGPGTNSTYRYGPGPGRPNLIRRTTQKKVTAREAHAALNKAGDKKRKGIK